MKYIASLALLATAFLSSTVKAELVTCSGNENKFMLDHASFDYPPNVAPTAIGDVCIGIRGNFKSVIPYDKSHIYFTASKEKGNKLKKEWDVDLSGALRVPETGLPIQVNNDLKIKVCSYLPPDFKNEKDTEIIITARITIPDNEGGKSNVLCVKGPLRLS